MIERYRVYNQGLKKLDDAGITERIESAVRGNKIRGMENVSISEVMESISKIDAEGFLKDMQKADRDMYKHALYGAVRNEDSCWITERKGGKVREKAVASDFLLMTGIRNLSILQNNELFDYRKFGFNGIFEFTGTVGAAIEMAAKQDGWKHGFAWNTNRDDGRTITSVVTGDGSGNMRIFQNDVTPYETLDPLGNRVYYRRLGSNDSMAVEAAHSTEGYLLVSILKYMEQRGIVSEMLQYGPRTATQYVASIEGDKAKSYEHMDQGISTKYRIPQLFRSWDEGIPRLRDGKKNVMSHAHFIPAALGEGYNIVIGNDGEFVIAKRAMGSIDTEHAVSFLPQEMDSLMQSLLYQSVKGLGRTTERELLDIIDYRFSTGLEKALSKARR